MNFLKSAILALWLVGPGFLLHQQGMMPGPGTPASSGGGCSFTDLFPGSSLSGNWSSYVVATTWATPAVGSAQVQNLTGTGYNVASFITYTASACFAQSQTAQLTIGAATTGSYLTYVSPVVNGNAALGNGYVFISSNIGKLVGGVFTAISGYCAYSPAVGSVLKLVNSSGTLTYYVNGSLMCTTTDSTYTGGNPGLVLQQGNQYAAIEGASTWSGSSP